MIHRQSITVLVAASLNLAGTAPLRASDSDGVEVRQRYAVAVEVRRCGQMRFGYIVEDGLRCVHSSAFR
mgnify:CR=1 FL=1